MKFPSLTEEEIIRAMYMEEGTYNYKVVSAKEKIPLKGGDPYIALDLVVWDKNGKERIVYCNLFSVKLIKHFCDANNMLDDYKAGEILDYKCLNKSGGKVQIGFMPQTDKYKAKNVVNDFIVDAGSEKPVYNSPQNNANTFDQDIPF